MVIILHRNMREPSAASFGRTPVLLGTKSHLTVDNLGSGRRLKLGRSFIWQFRGFRHIHIDPWPVHREIRIMVRNCSDTQPLDISAAVFRLNSRFAEVLPSDQTSSRPMSPWPGGKVVRRPLTPAVSGNTAGE